MDPMDVWQVPECVWGSSGPLLDQEPFRNIERFDDGLPTQLLSAAWKCQVVRHAQRSPCWRNCHIQRSSPEMHEHQVDSGWAHAAVDRGIWTHRR